MEMTPTDYGGMNDEQPIDPNKGFENPLYDSAHQVGVVYMQACENNVTAL